MASVIGSRLSFTNIKVKASLVMAGGFVATGGVFALTLASPTLAFGSHTLYVSSSASMSASGKSCQSAKYDHVQDAVDAANNGDTVYLCGGQYAEQVFVKKSITLTGDAGSGLTATGASFSSNPSDYPSQFASDGLALPQVLLVTTGNNVTVDGLKISGPLPGNGGCALDEYGVLALDGNLSLKNDTVNNIEDANSGLNGCQFGVGVQVGRTYWPVAGFGSDKTENFSATANIDGVTVTGYAKNGITVDGTGSSADISNSTVVGYGATTVVAQNGIQISRGAKGDVTNSTIADNAYSGAGEATAAGVLVYGGGGDPLSSKVTVKDNKLVDNDVAVNFANYNGNFSGSATTPTKDVATNNWIFSAKVTNTSGLFSSNDGWIGYQAGIEDVGNKDSACGNTIVGPGYTDQGSYNATTMAATPGPDHAVVRDIDAGYTFPTTDFSTCNYGQNYGGNNFNGNYWEQHHGKHSQRWY